EKMLYDNGQLLSAYAMAEAVGPAPDDPTLAGRVMRETAAYLKREMTDPSGAFWSAQDAEVDAREGGNYLWTEAQVRKAIGDEELADLAATMYGLDQGPNFQDPHDPSAEPANVIYLPNSLPELAEARELSLEELADRRQAINKQLLAVRDERKQPSTDDKVLAAWNGLAIAGLARAGEALDEPAYIQMAATAADAVLAKMFADDGTLYRVMRQGETSIPGFLDDYAFMAHGVMQLHAVDPDNDRRAHWLAAGCRLVEAAIERFDAGDEHGGGYYDTRAGQADLFVRVRSGRDGAVASGNAIMMHALLDLYEATGEDKWIDRAERDLRSFAAPLANQPTGMVYTALAVWRLAQMDPGRVTGGEGAADDGPVTAGFEFDAETGEGAVTLEIAEGYHLNAAEVDDADLIPTRLSVSEGWGLEADYPAGETASYPFADQPLSVYEGTVHIPVTLTPTDDDVATPRVFVRYQACTESACREPVTVEAT
ncbi:MAG: protein-disulfide reductase DsbD family protein, partial [Phycisphaeraceae bacterium]|nr:protein-disulfide reductase DsbD family protein [Phycisphaeraceae bacterium]